jgi:hypothetical protein
VGQAGKQSRKYLKIFTLDLIGGFRLAVAVAVAVAGLGPGLGSSNLLLLRHSQVEWRVRCEELRIDPRPIIYLRRCGDIRQRRTNAEAPKTRATSNEQLE